MVLRAKPILPKNHSNECVKDAKWLSDRRLARALINGHHEFAALADERVTLINTKNERNANFPSVAWLRALV